MEETEEIIRLAKQNNYHCTTFYPEVLEDLAFAAFKENARSKWRIVCQEVLLKCQEDPLFLPISKQILILMSLFGKQDLETAGAFHAQLMNYPDATMREQYQEFAKQKIRETFREHLMLFMAHIKELVEVLLRLSLSANQ